MGGKLLYEVATPLGFRARVGRDYWRLNRNGEASGDAGVRCRCAIRIQFQPGLSLEHFQEILGPEEYT